MLSDYELRVIGERIQRYKGTSPYDYGSWLIDLKDCLQTITELKSKLLAAVERAEKAESTMKRMEELFSATFKRLEAESAAKTKCEGDLREALNNFVMWLTETDGGRAVPQIKGQPGGWLKAARKAIDSRWQQFLPKAEPEAKHCHDEKETCDPSCDKG